MEQGEDYTMGCLLDYDHIIIQISLKKELDTNPTAIQQIKSVEQTKKIDNNDNAADKTITIKPLKLL